MYELTYTTPWGDTYELTSGRGGGVFMEPGGLDGMAAEGEDVAVSAPFSTGQVLDDINVGPLEGTLTVTITPTAEQDLEEVQARFRAGFSRAIPGTLTLTTATLGALSCQVRLAGPIKNPDTNTKVPTSRGVVVPLRSDGGVWKSRPLSHPGPEVSVTNPGDVPIHPQIHWSGAGGQVRQPSGHTFTLPRVSDTRILWLDNAESCVVTDADLRKDDTLCDQLSPTVYPEAVPPGRTRTYRLPAGASLRWQVSFFDPWK